ncbi:MAG: hypothetical protein JWN76_1095 [Chitinophagaceae bacterium]|nr:hypothetical protein [Chitinophagaceae bacterium]
MQDKKNNDPASTGNASNPGEDNNADQKEKYLREAGNIEDYPDAQDQQDVDNTAGKNK